MRIWYCTATVMRAWQRISSQDAVLAMSLVRVPMPESFSASLRCTGERKDGKTIFSIRVVLLA